MARKWIDSSDPGQSQRMAAESAYAGGQNSEWKLLVMWAAAQMEGKPLDPEFEHAATALLVSAIAHQKLPVKRGKPEQKPRKGSPREVAAALAELLESDLDVKRDDAVAELAQRFHIDERTVESRLSRADDDWQASADTTHDFLRRTFPATGPRAIRTNAAMLALTKRLAAKK